MKISPQLLLATHRFMATGMTAHLCLNPRRLKQNLEGGTQAPIIFITLQPNSSVQPELRTTVPGEEIALGGATGHHLVSFPAPGLDLVGRK